VFVVVLVFYAPYEILQFQITEKSN